MRHPFAAVVFTLGALLSTTAVPAFAADDPMQQNAAPAPEQGSNPSAQGHDNRKTSGTTDQSGPSSTKSQAADPNSQGDQATHTVSGRNGKQEPGSHAPTGGDTTVFVNGKLNVPDAPTDSQTVPAKFSARNDQLDNKPIMATPIGLSDAQKRAIAEAVGRAGVAVVQTNAKPAEELPWHVAIHDLPNATSDPRLGEFKYVRTPDRILLVRPSNRVVVGEIEK